MGGTTCRTCLSGERAAIEHARASGQSLKKLSARFGLSKQSIQRHFANDHTPAIIRDKQAAIALVGAAVDLDQLRATENDGLLRHIASARSKLYQLLDKAGGDVKTATAVHNAITSNLTLLAKVLGQVGGSSTTVNQNLIISPDYLRMRSTLLKALSPPEFRAARLAVAAALRLVEAAPEPKAIEVIPAIDVTSPSVGV
jgi:hypothetical protein